MIGTAYPGREVYPETYRGSLKIIWAGSSNPTLGSFGTDCSMSRFVSSITRTATGTYSIVFTTDAQVVNPSIAAIPSCNGAAAAYQIAMGSWTQSTRTLVLYTLQNTTAVDVTANANAYGLLQITTSASGGR